MMNSLNYLKNNSKFSTDEIMPILEQKISSLKGEKYKIDFFITNMGDSTTKLKVYYYAFPQKEVKPYMKAFFIYNGFIYAYSIEDEKHETFKKIPASKYNTNAFDFTNILREQHDDTLLIGKETIKIEDALAYLLLPHKPKYHLFNNFFCYEQELEQIDNTIVNFAKQKLPNK